MTYSELSLSNHLITGEHNVVKKSKNEFAVYIWTLKAGITVHI